MQTRSLTLFAGAAVLAGLPAFTAQAGPWVSFPSCEADQLGSATTCMPTLHEPKPPIFHPGKEYMWETNRDFDGTPNPGQVIAWDGAGGVENSQINYGVSGVDALANPRDHLYYEVINNLTAILYSERTDAAWGQASDTEFPIYYETTTGARGGWATREQVNQNWAQLEADGATLNLGGLEIFGPNSPQQDDSFMFSVHEDIALLPDGVRYSVYSFSGGSIDGYLSVEVVATAVSEFYNIPFGEIEPLIDLDALMAYDVGDPFVWDEGDSVLFSLMPFSAGGIDFVGDAAYVLDFGQDLRYLDHGGHLWENNWLGTNIDALEAAAIAEPASVALLGCGLLGLMVARRRRI